MKKHQFSPKISFNCGKHYFIYKMAFFLNLATYDTKINLRLKRIIKLMIFHEKLPIW